MLVAVDLYLVDATAELFRQFHTLPPAKNYRGEEVAAVRGVNHSIRGLVQNGATHIGIATHSAPTSFRNEMWPDYKSGDGIPHELSLQFSLLEEGLKAWGLTLWPMVECEAEDALASAAAQAALDPRVDRVLICSPGAILAQCVRNQRVVQFDRVRKTTRDEAGVLTKFGVSPASIPDYLALVGDPSHGLPGLPGWGGKSAAAVLARFGHIDAIPDDPRSWGTDIARAGLLGAALKRERPQAELFRRLATLRTDVATFETVDDLAWRGPTPDLPRLRQRLAIARGRRVWE